MMHNSVSLPGLTCLHHHPVHLLPHGRRLVCAPPCAKKGKQQGSAKAGKRGKPSAGPVSSSVVPPAAPAAAPAGSAEQQQPAAAAPAAVQRAQAPAAAAAAPSPPPQPQPPPLQRGSNASRVVAETPQVVVDRMFKRVITFAGLPVITGMLLFPAFWYLRVVQKVEYPIWVVYVTQALMFGGGLLGISYGILSTSWDPKREGTALGWTELQANLPILLNRNKEQQGE